MKFIRVLSALSLCTGLISVYSCRFQTAPTLVDANSSHIQAPFLSGYFSIVGSSTIFEDAATGRLYDVFDDEPFQDLRVQYQQRIRFAQEKLYIELKGLIRSKSQNQSGPNERIHLIELIKLDYIQKQAAQHLAGTYTFFYPNKNKPERFYRLNLHPDYSFQLRCSSLLGETLECSTGQWFRADRENLILEGHSLDGTSVNLPAYAEYERKALVLYDDKHRSMYFENEHFFFNQKKTY